MERPDLHDLQGLIVRGYGMPTVSHLAFRVVRSGTARRRIGELVGPPDGTSLRVMTGAEWPQGVKPEVCVNLGFTFEGLKALRLSEASIQSFPEDFKQGARERVKRLFGRDRAELESVRARPDLDPCAFGGAAQAGCRADPARVHY